MKAKSKMVLCYIIMILAIVCSVLYFEYFPSILKAIKTSTDTIALKPNSENVQQKEATAIQNHSSYKPVKPKAQPIKPKAQSVKPKVQKETHDLKLQDNTSVWITNHLDNGSLPYLDVLGRNAYSGDAEIRINAPSNSDVVVIVKNSDFRKIKHAYLRAGCSYTFHMSQGSYECFFYYGKGWNPNKPMPGGLTGGFVANEVFSKSGYEYLQDDYEGSQILTYSLKLTHNGNFQTKSTNRSDMFD